MANSPQDRSRSFSSTAKGLHRNVCEAVINCLQEIFENGRYADKVIEKTLKSNPKWGSRDRKFIAESVYEIVRWYRLLEFTSKASPNDYWSIFGTWLLSDGIELPKWEEFNTLNTNELKENYQIAQATRKIKESIPDWLDELGEKELGNNWNNQLIALNDTASVVLRTNTLKIDTKKLQKLLLIHGIETTTLNAIPEALILKKRQNIFSLPEFQNGFFEVQDAGSQLIAPFLNIDAGMRVIDACAGAGGKSLHLAALMQNTGRLISMDVEDWKLKELQKRAKRAGVSIIETKLIDSSKTIKRLEATADRLLLDVPCSGLGVLKRNPDAKWKLSLQAIAEVKAKQEEILNTYANMLKSNGLMVYATCSILPSENNEQVEKFIKTKAGEYTLLKENQIWPAEGFDGFYMALIKRN
ncbi:MAG: RsmB/NOP family class I SAM-dependent RNA methyltransferase [Cytophagales bacterium]